MRLLLVLVPSLLLGFLFVSRAADVARLQGPRAEVGRIKLTTLSDDMRRRIATLRDRVYLTYYVSPRRDMPSHMRHVEDAVTDLLFAMRRAAPDKVRVYVVDPTRGKDDRRFAGRRKVAPVRVRSVKHDSYSEREVFSTLTIEYGPRPPAMVAGIGPDHLPRLQALIVQHLDQLESPREPVFALSAPAQGFSLLRQYLEGAGRVIEINLEAEPALPQDADVLFWVAPRNVDDTRIRNLRHFLESGKSVFVAGSLYRPVVDQGAGVLRLERSGFDARALLGAFGLRPREGLVLDRKPSPLPLPTGEPDTPFRITCLALNQDFQSMAKEPRGTLLFVAPTAVALDAERLSELGYKAEVLATTSDETSIVEDVAAGVPLDSMGPGAGVPAAKQPLMVRLDHVDPWHGTFLFCASSDILRDDTFGIDTLAHKRMVEAVVATLAADDRLVRARSAALRSPPLPALDGGERMLWRVVVVFLFPGAFLLLFAARTLRRPRAKASPGRERPGILPWALGTCAMVLVASAAAYATRGVARADLTSAGLNQLSDFSREIAGKATGEHAVEAELIASGPARLPPEMRGDVARLEGMLDEYRRAGADLTVRRVRPEDLGEEEREALVRQGIQPVKVTSRADEVTTVRNVYCSLRLRANGREEILPFVAEDAFEHLEFRLTFALWRLQTGRRPHIAFASATPRLSAAENFQFFQQKGLIAPSGKDVYSLARDTLRGCDFRVTHVVPRAGPNDPETELPEDIDALFWIQPQRNVAPMLETTVDYLYRGGNVFVAAQHFVVQSRQYRGARGGNAAFEFNYWPQPQSPDVEEYYYPDLGVKMVREVLFDASFTMAELWTMLFRSARREFEFMRHAKPFLIRAVAQNYDRESVFTQGLGDLPFLFGSFFELDRARLDELGLKARVLITTTEKAWRYDWTGGWLNHGLLPDPGDPILKSECEAAGLPDLDPFGDPYIRPEEYTGKVPLAVLIEGQFPWPEHEFQQMPKVFGPDGELQEQEEPPPFDREEPKDRAAPGRLLLVGNCEMFKDQRLAELRPQFRPDHFLLNIAAGLSLPEDLARVMTRRTVKPGFGAVPARERNRWRAIVLGTLPALMLLLFAGRSLLVRAPVAP